MLNGGSASPIDDLMDRASLALAQADYFQSERLCVRALGAARAAGDFERMARICLPLLEARRQKRQLAESGGRVIVVSAVPGRSLPAEPACYLFRPPTIALEARAFREQADRRAVPALVLCREPMTRAGKWPIAAVGESRLIGMTTVRVQVDPPAGVSFTGEGPTRDGPELTPSVEWFTAAAEALGDGAIAKVNPKLPAAFRVDDLMAALDAFPDHEKLHQRLEETCRQAALEPPPTTTLPREWIDSDYR